jgi:hypothetical protein
MLLIGMTRRKERIIATLPNLSGPRYGNSRLARALFACALHAGGWAWDQAVKLSAPRRARPAPSVHPRELSPLQLDPHNSVLPSDVTLAEFIRHELARRDREQSAGVPPHYHFLETTKLIVMGKGAERRVVDHQASVSDACGADGEESPVEFETPSRREKRA